MGESIPVARTAALTAATMVAFAANSVLCRMALAERAVDAASFTTVRLLSGAVALVCMSRLLRRERPAAAAAEWAGPVFLFLYAAGFSFAYLTLPAGTGALVLFGAVQATMIASGLRSGERPRPLEWVGFAAAVGGLVYLVSPGVARPSLAGSALMAGAGVSWGVYSLRGRGTGDALAATTSNFVRAVPLALLVSLVWIPRLEVSARGLLLAVLSGAIASGMGYVVWYAALRGLGAIEAAMVQLSVPVIAALGGVALLDERVSMRLVLSAVAVLGGVALAVGSGRRPRRS